MTLSSALKTLWPYVGLLNKNWSHFVTETKRHTIFFPVLCALVYWIFEHTQSDVSWTVMGIHLQALHSSWTLITKYETTRRNIPEDLQSSYRFQHYSFLHREWKSSTSYPRRPQLVQRRTTAWKAGVGFPTGARDFSSLHSVQPRSGAHPVSYPVDEYRHLLP
jgi:hypothetical protein